ncbi:amidase [Phreatobacter aquaticus]|uniref:amidase n=1 Tax=Phreatobacter aquaticus TaxID=2570229 RepID=UPI00143CFEC5|nr:amidase [Phreatobacter aquaticus]
MRPLPAYQSHPVPADPCGAFVAFNEHIQPAANGPLAGTRFALKDLADTIGRPPSCGLTRLPSPPPVSNAPVVTRLLDAGASLTGFATMTPLAYEPSGGNPVQGRPRNPWSGSHICGGSSSGSAVAVAGRMVDFAIGSDTGGSLRIPAQCCGVAAWKPTHGLVPVGGTMALAPSLDTLGFLANDCALLLGIAQVFDAGPLAQISSVCVAQDVAASCAPDIAAALERAVSALRSIGLDVREAALAPLISACDRPVMTVMQAEAARVNLPLIEAGSLDPVLATRLRKGLSIDDETLQAATTDLQTLADDQWPALLGDADAVLLPVMRISTPRVEVCEPASASFSARTLYELSALTRWVNGLGLPAVAIPVGLDDEGMPIAMQIVGRRASDLPLLKLACLLHHVLPPMPSPPGLPGMPR